MSTRKIDSLVADIASHVPVDWRTVDPQHGHHSRFRIIATIGANRRRPDASASQPRAVRLLLDMAVAAAAVKVTVALAAMVLATPIRVGPRALMTTLFGVASLLLFATGRRDHRALSLAGLLILIASPFAQSYVMRATTGPLAGPAFILSGVTPEAFLALSLWSFSWVFPGPPRTRAAKRLGRLGLTAAAIIGSTFFLVNAVREFASFPDYPLVESTLQLLDRSADTLVFWPVVIATVLLALPYLLWKSMAGTVDERSRAVCLPLSLLAGLLPIGLAVVLAPFVPALREADARDMVGVGLYFALASLIPVTAYLVLVRKALRVHLVIRRAARHALARQSVWAVLLLTLSYVAASLYAGRAQPLGQLLSEQFGLMMIAATGFGVLTFRSQILQGIDRWFARGPADYSEVMARLGDEIRGQRNLRELHSTVVRELSRTLDATRVTVLVMNEERTALIGLEPGVEPLQLPSAIAELSQDARGPLCLTPDDEDARLSRLLPADEQQWLAKVGVNRVFPLRDSTDSLFGLLCVGQDHGSAFTSQDQTLVTVLSDQLALRVENLSLRHGLGTKQIDWPNQCATQCPECGLVFAADAFRCSCGSTLEAASLPLLLNRKFQVERVLGAGGMSVVYQATDTELKRRVAIKAMPKATPTHIARLEREARVMAAVRHPNLAMIHGAERWRDVPLLVVELLPGGTLLDALRSEPMAEDEVLDLGILLADALDCMHWNGLLHRDIKPSNIGYDAEGVPKLLDFGLAAALRDATEDAGAEEGGRSPQAAGSFALTGNTLTQHLVGTPLYLSPEALAGERPEPSFDVWSLSLVLYEAIAGRHPFAGYPTEEVLRRTRAVRIPDVRDFCRSCHPQVAALLNDALSLSKERRPATAADLRTQLQALRPAFAPPAARPSRRPVY